MASRAESLGVQVMRGWCYEHVGVPPYWPYVHPIRAYVETADAELLASQMGSGVTSIAEIVPELRGRLPDLSQAVAAEPQQARFRLFDSVATFLKNVAQSQPLKFVLDNLHWANSSSLLMLEFLVREIATSPLLILGTYRDVEITGSHSLSQTLGNLVRKRHYRRVHLDGLTQQEMGEFVQANAGVTLPDDALETIHNRTDGNHLFVNESASSERDLASTPNASSPGPNDRAWVLYCPKPVPAKGRSPFHTPSQSKPPLRYTVGSDFPAISHPKVLVKNPYPIPVCQHVVMESGIRGHENQTRRL